MIIRQYVSEGLAHYSYMVISGGRAAVIDPRRDFGIYVKAAEDASAAIVHIFETHRNEDYVIGSIDLARCTGATIRHGDSKNILYGTTVADGERFRLGTIDLHCIATPGHTEESISIAVYDQGIGGGPYCVFTGDALFAGDLGRTDLVPGKREEMSRLLYESVVDKILPLGDGVLVFPSHGAGSVCGGHIAERHPTSIGFERKANPLLAAPPEEFVRVKSTEHYYIPPYFRRMENWNQQGAPSFRMPSPRPFSVGELKAQMAGGAQILDIRSPTSFAGGHVPGSLNIWRGGMSVFMGWFVAYERPFVLIVEANTDIGEVAVECARIGYDNLIGFLASDFSTYFKAGEPVGTLKTWSAPDLERRLSESDLFLLDVRDVRNRDRDGFIKGSMHIYIGDLPVHIDDVPRDRHVVVYCDSGFKGSIGASLLAKSGYPRVTNLLGGMNGWINAGFPVERMEESSGDPRPTTDDADTGITSDDRP